MTTNALKEGLSTPKAGNIIADVAQSTQMMGFNDSVNYIHTLLDDKEKAIFQIGAALYAMKDTDDWKSKAETFQDFVKVEFGLDKRTAYYYINIYDGIVESGLTWADVAHLGWTKLRILSTVFLKKIGSPAEWVEKAGGLTCNQLIEEVNKALKQASGKTLTESETSVSEVSTLTFKVHPDQKDNIEGALESAMSQYGTEFKSVALDGICTAYMSGAVASSEGTEPLSHAKVKEFLKEGGIELMASYIDELWPDIEVTITIPE